MFYKKELISNFFLPKPTKPHKYVKVNLTEHTTYPFLRDSELGELILKYNWSQTSIGGIQQWPQSLRTTLGIMLHSAFPMFLFWGKELICFYNDAFRPSLGVDMAFYWAADRRRNE